MTQNISQESAKCKLSLNILRPRHSPSHSPASFVLTRSELLLSECFTSTFWHFTPAPESHFTLLTLLPPSLLIILLTPTFFPASPQPGLLTSIINLVEWVYSKLGVKVISSPFLLGNFITKTGQARMFQILYIKSLANILLSRLSSCNILKFWDETLPVKQNFIWSCWHIYCKI